MKRKLVFYFLSGALTVILLVVLLNMVAKNNIKPSDPVARTYTKDEI